MLPLVLPEVGVGVEEEDEDEEEEDDEDRDGVDEGIEDVVEDVDVERRDIICVIPVDSFVAT